MGIRGSDAARSRHASALVLVAIIVLCALISTANASATMRPFTTSHVVHHHHR